MTTQSESDKLLRDLAIVAVVVLALSLWNICHAAPFLICDPQNGATSYVVIMNGFSEEVPAQDLGDNTTRLHYDLAGIAEGTYDCNITAKSVWGESAPVPFSFKKIMPECPSVLTISAQ